MAVPVNLRVCGIEFDRIELKKSLDKTMVEVTDSRFGAFTLDHHMKLEIKENGRSSSLNLSSVTSSLLECAKKQ